MLSTPVDALQMRASSPNVCRHTNQYALTCTPLLASRRVAELLCQHHTALDGVLHFAWKICSVAFTTLVRLSVHASYNANFTACCPRNLKHHPLRHEALIHANTCTWCSLSDRRPTAILSFQQMYLLHATAHNSITSAPPSALKNGCGGTNNCCTTLPLAMCSIIHSHCCTVVE